MSEHIEQDNSAGVAGPRQLCVLCALCGGLLLAWTLPCRAQPGSEVVELKLPPLEEGDLRFPINLAAALQLADARPVLVAAAQARAWVAEAQLQKAKVLWVPTLNLGFD